MTKFEAYKKTKSNIESLVNDLTRLVDKKFPTEIDEALIKVLDIAKNYKVEKPTLENVNGEILDLKYIKDLVTEATQYLWKETNESTKERFGLEEEDGWSDLIARRFGIYVSEENVRTLFLYRNTNNRSELSHFTFICIPGHFYMEWGSGRADCGSDGVLQNAQMKKSLFENC